MYKAARQFVKLANLPDKQLFQALETGLTLVAQNTSHLTGAAAVLAEQDHGRAARILASHAADEAGKFLMLIDAARCPRGHLPDHLKRIAAAHLSRLLYAETASRHDATFGDLVQYINDERQSHYLDGPGEGPEWVFRNALLFWREQAIYVDYVEREDATCEWQDPDYFEPMMVDSRPDTIAADLVGALSAAGLHRAPALAVVAARWRGFVPKDETRITEVRREVRATWSDLQARHLVEDDSDLPESIEQRWTFPLWSVDTSEQPMKMP